VPEKKKRDDPMRYLYPERSAVHGDRCAPRETLTCAGSAGRIGGERTEDKREKRDPDSRPR
jgi:hypothetical protein